eukprot:scaffold51324_cov47-Phaeocystis_antarctica.AAC.2
MPQFERCYAQYSSTYTSVTDGLRRARQEDAPPHGHCRNAAPAPHGHCRNAAPWQCPSSALWQRLGRGSALPAPEAPPWLCPRSYLSLSSPSLYPLVITPARRRWTTSSAEPSGRAANPNPVTLSPTPALTLLLTLAPTPTLALTLTLTLTLTLILTLTPTLTPTLTLTLTLP